MHIVMLSDFEFSGGAAVAATRLASGLVHAGHTVTRIVGFAEAGERAWNTVRLGRNDFSFRATRRVVPSLAALLFGTQLKQKLKDLLWELQPDAVNVHNVHGAAPVGWSLDFIAASAGHVPTVWTLHDMWSFTGSCAYSYDCLKYVVGCDRDCFCPREYPKLPNRQIAHAWRRRQQVIGTHSDLVAVAPSHWLHQRAKDGLWRNRTVRLIPYGIPLNTFRPMSRAAARQELGLPDKGPILLAAAPDWTDPRKGGRFLAEAMELISTPLTVLVIGRGTLTMSRPGWDMHHLGSIKDENRMALAYNAADLFVHPALIDNLPNTILESIACGTPVVAYKTGGIPEMVRDGSTGWLVSEMTSQCLAERLDDALTGVGKGDHFRESSRAVAELEYGSQLQAERYIQLFQNVD